MAPSMGKASGSRINLTLVRIITKESTSMTGRMGMVFSNGSQEIDTREIIRMILDMDMVKCTGLMGLSIRVNGSKAYSMGMER